MGEYYSTGHINCGQLTKNSYAKRIGQVDITDLMNKGYAIQNPFELGSYFPLKSFNNIVSDIEKNEFLKNIGFNNNFEDFKKLKFLEFCQDSSINQMKSYLSVKDKDKIATFVIVESYDQGKIKDCHVHVVTKFKNARIVKTENDGLIIIDDHESHTFKIIRLDNNDKLLEINKENYEITPISNNSYILKNRINNKYSVNSFNSLIAKEINCQNFVDEDTFSYPNANVKIPEEYYDIKLLSIGTTHMTFDVMDASQNHGIYLFYTTYDAHLDEDTMEIHTKKRFDKTIIPPSFNKINKIYVENITDQKRKKTYYWEKDEYLSKAFAEVVINDKVGVFDIINKKMLIPAIFDSVLEYDEDNREFKLLLGDRKIIYDIERQKYLEEINFENINTKNKGNCLVKKY